MTGVVRAVGYVDSKMLCQNDHGFSPVINKEMWKLHTCVGIHLCPSQKNRKPGLKRHPCSWLHCSQ